MKKSMLILAALLILSPSNAYSQRWVDKTKLPYNITDAGGCKIISVQKDKAPSKKLLEWCGKLKTPKPINGQSWHDYFSSLEYDLGSAFIIAERSLGGSRFAITGKRNVQIVIYHEPYANASVSATEKELIISINDGLIELIEQVASGIELEFNTLSGSNIKGVYFSDWLELMRTPFTSGAKKQYRAGPDVKQVKGFWPTWRAQTRIKASMLYQFIFGHELAHIVREDTLTTIQNNPMKVEVDCDARSFKAFAKNKDTDKAFFVIVPYLIGWWYHENYWKDEIENSGRPIYTGSRPSLYTRNWKERANRIIELWGKIGSSDERKKKKMFIKQYDGYVNARAPLNTSAIESASFDKLELKGNGEFDKSGANPKVKYGVLIKNNHSNKIIEAKIEVQSRYYSRDKKTEHSNRAPRDESGRRYFVFQTTVHKVKINPGKARFLDGKLKIFGNKVAYPGINYRVIGAKYIF